MTDETAKEAAPTPQDTAADGQGIPMLRHFDQLIATLDDGDLNQDASEKLLELTKALTDFVINHGGSPTGEITLKLRLKYDGGSFAISPKLTMTKPVEPRPTSHMWGTPEGFLTPFNPQQLQMFGGPRSAK